MALDKLPPSRITIHPHASDTTVRFGLGSSAWPLVSIDHDRFSLSGCHLAHGSELHAMFMFAHCVTVTVRVRADVRENGAQVFVFNPADESIAHILNMLVRSEPGGAIGH